MVVVSSVLLRQEETLWIILNISMDFWLKSLCPLTYSHLKVIKYLIAFCDPFILSLTSLRCGSLGVTSFDLGCKNNQAPKYIGGLNKSPVG